MSGGAPLTLHASSVEIAGRAVVIEGPSGSGKSALALALVTRGGRLIADDMTRIAPAPGAPPRVEGPGRLAGVVEARGVGLIRVPYSSGAPLDLAIDLGQVEPDRLPPDRGRSYLGHTVQLLLNPDAPHFADAIFQLMQNGRYA